MPLSSNRTPPLSPVLLAGFALTPVPAIIFQPLLDAAMDVMGRRHSRIFDRISKYGHPVYLIDPIDLPYVFVFHPDIRTPKLVARPSNYSCGADATIRGPLACLLAMLEGRTDGDALFFSRELVIDGDTEAIVALRNAIDDAEICLKEDFLSLFGHFSGPAKILVELAERVTGAATRDLETLRQAVISPSMRRHERQESTLRELSDRLEASIDKGKRSRKTKA